MDEFDVRIRRVHHADQRDLRSMTASTGARPALTESECVRALKARDARFDGVFFVGITSTSIYCRPICPARVSRPDNRRFFGTAAAAERAGFRPCRRCRPELAPGRSLVDAVSRLAGAAAQRIAAGALNGRSVRELANELCVSERHLRRALEREIGASPVELAQTHRLLLAKRLLTDTALPITHVAYTSGFQSLRRFNVAFRERYGMNPSALRRGTASARGRHSRDKGAGAPDRNHDGWVRLTLAYRTPYAWDDMFAFLARDSAHGVEQVRGSRYARTVRIGAHSGVVLIDAQKSVRADASPGGASLVAHVSTSLLPVLMPLLAALRHLFDLDAEPTVIDSCLARNGLGSLVRRRPGIRMAGAIDGFDAGLRLLLRGKTHAARRRASTDGASAAPTDAVTDRVIRALGEPIETGVSGLTHLAPTAQSVADAGAKGLVMLGVSETRARSIEAFARAVADDTIRLVPGSDVAETCRALAALPGIGGARATAIAARALAWPDTFHAADPTLVRAAGLANGSELLKRAEAWRPWRAYAAVHLRENVTARVERGTNPRSVVQ
jgi:AraC family transcriptional regulator, regulatory protein of adaptative response / DNA-3-methyladenine glycosylase II